MSEGYHAWKPGVMLMLTVMISIDDKMELPVRPLERSRTFVDLP
jgi:hypothetical protein